MVRALCLCVGLLLLTGCDLFSGLFGPQEPPVVQPGPEPAPAPVFVRHFQGEANVDFASIALYRNSFLQSRLVLEVVRLLDSMNFDLALPECLKLTEGSNTGSYQWRGLLVQPGTYEKVVDWEQYKPDCPPNGTLFFTVSSGPTGESGSIPFDWLED